MSARYEASIRIAKDHPALAGHFPGQPVVPGVLLLDRLLDAAEAQLGHPLRVAGLAHAKFPSPLLPEEEAQLSFQIDDRRLDFEIEREGRLIARGVFQLAADPDPAPDPAPEPAP
jgi:3-hydroxymyristoyl/3-hydroxydecanoyl-(acyl carrier protein) dehydratase